nr:protein stb3 [Quercus suber]
MWEHRVKSTRGLEVGGWRLAGTAGLTGGMLRNRLVVGSSSVGHHGQSCGHDACAAVGPWLNWRGRGGPKGIMIADRIPSSVQRRTRQQPVILPRVPCVPSGLLACWPAARSKALDQTPSPVMAQVSTTGMAFAVPTPSVDIPKVRDCADGRAGLLAWEKKASALLTPPSSISPDLPPNHAHPGLRAPPPMTGDKEMDLSGMHEHSEGHPSAELDPMESPAMPLSRGALSGLDAAAAITPAMLAKHHLPAIMLGNGPKPIRYVMGELTQSVPGFSRIPPAKARRLVVAALESRHGGGPDGNVAFCKTGWGRWDAHIKGSARDSAVGSFNEGHFSPPRSEHGSYAFSHADSGMQMHGNRLPAHRDHHSGGSWTTSSLREEDELDMDMDVPENEADKMSLDGHSMDDDSESLNDDTDEEDWSAVGADVLRKASLPTPGMPRKNYNALSASYKQRYPSSSWTRRPSSSLTRRPSGVSDRRPSFQSFQSKSVPFGAGNMQAMHPALASPAEKDAIAALLSMGSILRKSSADGRSWIDMGGVHSPLTTYHTSSRPQLYHSQTNVLRHLNEFLLSQLLARNARRIKSGPSRKYLASTSEQILDCHGRHCFACQIWHGSVFIDTTHIINIHFQQPFQPTTSFGILHDHEVQSARGGERLERTGHPGRPKR